MAYKPRWETRWLLRKGKPARMPWRKTLTVMLDVLSVAIAIAGVYWLFAGDVGWALAAWGIAAIVFGIRETFVQDLHTIVRIYGPLGRMRYLFEREFRDKFLQYFNERNMDGRPIPRIVRDYIYQKAKGLKSVSSFGTELDIYDVENTVGARLLHRHFGVAFEQPDGFAVEIGAHRPEVRTFVVRNVINVSGMSFGSINHRAAEALSVGAKGVAYVNTGEGGYGPHGIAGNDVVFQIGTGKFGVGRFVTLPDGRETRALDESLLQSLVRQHENIRMIQIKLSQGAKPGMGGYLPGEKVTEEIAEIRKIPVGKSIQSPPQHYELWSKTPEEGIRKLLEWIKRLRKLTELPVGIKLCVGRLEEVDLLVTAMAQTGEGPDAIQIDGADGGTGAAANLFLNYVGFGGAIETLFYFHRQLQRHRIRDRVVLSLSGRIFTPAHAAVAFAFGADYIDSARGPMLALGCIQSLKCHTNQCPTGITTNNPWRMRGLDIPEKSVRVRNYLMGYHQDMMEITRAMGHADPRDITPDDLRMFNFRSLFAFPDGDDPWGVFPLPVVEKLPQ